jgi:hypothetical protein
VVELGEDDMNKLEEASGRPLPYPQWMLARMRQNV